MSETVFEIGMTADRVLAVEKLRKTPRLKKNSIIDDGDLGLTVAWFLPDCTLILKRDGGYGPYQVAEVGEPLENKRATISVKRAGLSDEDVAAWRKMRKELEKEK